MQSERQVRQDVLCIAHALGARTWVANHDGNITARMGQNRILATPTALAKSEICDKDLLVVGPDGKRLQGTRRLFSEFALHAAVLSARSDVHAVVHAHPPYATAIACSGSTRIERPFIAEAVVSLGPWIPTVPFAPPGPPAIQALKPYLNLVDVVLLANHGVLAWGKTVEIAYRRMELVEHLARIATISEATGGVRQLPDSAISPLLSARAKAGLGSAADKAETILETLVQNRLDAISSTTTPTNNELAALIRDELTKLLAE